ncbi:MAG: prolipoprotein diacylglyceryl transferase [Oscillospiraceae bacterium]|nr:prolipoprotein diacylglyceryl transferase [Oscillospiraceae bacterium]
MINPPRYITIFGFNIYIYGILIAIGFLLGLLYLQKRREALGLESGTVFDMVIMAVPGGVIGSRLFFVLFNASEFFGEGNRWQDIFNFRLGGLAIYGGVIGAAIAFLIYSRIKKIPFLRLADAGAFGLFIGQVVGRWGNFLNREAFGVETTVPWRMGLTFGIRAIYVHPTFLYEALWNTMGFILLHIFSKKRKTRYDGQLFFIYVAWYGFGRSIIEGLRADSIFFMNTDIRVSQVLAAVSFFAAAALLIWNHMRRRGQNPETLPEPTDNPDSERSD